MKRVYYAQVSFTSDTRDVQHIVTYYLRKHHIRSTRSNKVQVVTYEHYGPSAEITIPNPKHEDMHKLTTDLLSDSAVVAIRVETWYTKDK